MGRGARSRRRAAHLPPSEAAPYYRRAGRAYQAAIERAPAVPELWAERANLALEEQQPDAALSMLERALSLGGALEVEVVADAALGALDIDAKTRQGARAAAAALTARRLPYLAAFYAERGHDRPGVR